MTPLTSSNVNEVTRAVSNFFIYERFHTQKAQNANKWTKIKKAAFLCAYETSKEKKSLTRLFALFVLAKSFH